MEVVPISQILFGTDYPYRSCTEHVANLRKMALTLADTAMIERGNAVRLMPQLA